MLGAARKAARTGLLIKLSPLLGALVLVGVLLVVILATLTKTKNTAAAAVLCDPTYLAQLGEPAAAGAGQSALAQREIPQTLIPIYLAAAERYRLGPDGWSYLAAINQRETSFGTNLSTSSAGALGWMQFMPGTWAAYGVDADGDGVRDPHNPRDAIHAAARYLSASGAPGDWYRALFAYNHADWYVRGVQETAASYRGPPGSQQVSTADTVTVAAGNVTDGPPPTNPTRIEVKASYRGFASVYGNDPSIGYIDPGDVDSSGRPLPPALPGANNAEPGIAVFNHSTLGGWWSVQAPNGRTGILQQIDYGPSAKGRDGRRRVVDINTVAARVVFELGHASQFPTDAAPWTITYLGRRRPDGAIGQGGAVVGDEARQTTACGCPIPQAAPTPDSEGGTGVVNANGGVGFTPAPGKDFATGREPDIARRADALGKALGLRLTGISGRRTPEHNAAVGGSETSQHLTGEAADIDGIQEVPQETLQRFGLHRPIAGNWVGTDGQVHDERNHIVLAPGTEDLTLDQILAGARPGADAGDPGTPAAGQDPCVASPGAQTVPGRRARILPDGTAVIPEDAPDAVKAMIAAGNRLLDRPYIYGGGHGEPLDQLVRGYDCSSTVSFVLHAARRFGSIAWASGDLMSYGASGPGAWVTIYAHGGHAFMEIAGIRMDTSRAGDQGPRVSESGPRWRTATGQRAGFTVRHPEGL